MIGRTSEAFGFPLGTVHDPGCTCWPHVSAGDVDEAAVRAGLAEYHIARAAAEAQLQAVRKAAIRVLLASRDDHPRLQDALLALQEVVWPDAATKDHEHGWVFSMGETVCSICGVAATKGTE